MMVLSNNRGIWIGRWEWQVQHLITTERHIEVPPLARLLAQVEKG
jgi:hypothetical protein